MYNTISDRDSRNSGTTQQQQQQRRNLCNTFKEFRCPSSPPSLVSEATTGRNDTNETTATTTSTIRSADDDEAYWVVMDDVIVDCTVSYIRELTSPPIHYPPPKAELKTELESPWKVQVPVDFASAEDVTTCNQWKEQKRNKLFHQMIFALEKAKDNNPPTTTSSDQVRQRVNIQPYFNFTNSSSSFGTNHSKEIALSVFNLLFRRVGCRQKGSFVSLHSHGQTIFLATTVGYLEEEIWSMQLNSTYYCLRCHSTSAGLTFGYHSTTTSPSSEGTKDPRKTFHPLIKLSTSDVDFRLKTCQVITNVARILNSLIDYGVPLTCEPLKRCVVDHNTHIQKIYTRTTTAATTDQWAICGIPNVTVQTMIDAYRMLESNQVPHTDRLLNVVEEIHHDDERPTKKRSSVNANNMSSSSSSTTMRCTLGPIGRSYPPKNVNELLDALICVTEVLVAIHKLGMIHRDIRWSNVFRAIVDDVPCRQQQQQGQEGRTEEFHNTAAATKTFSNEWVLFDFEFASTSSPQPSFGRYTLTRSNHAPEMFLTTTNSNSATQQFHTTAVDIWSIGYLIQTANVDIPVSHKHDLERLRTDCMNDPNQRPIANQCLETLQNLKARPCSQEMEIQYVS